MTVEQVAAAEHAPVIPRPARHQPGTWPEPGEDENLRERLSEFRALLVISLLMTESVSEDQILELAVSAAPGLGPWRIEGYGFCDGQWRAATAAIPGTSTSHITRQLAALGHGGGKVELPGCHWAWAYPLRSVSGLQRSTEIHDRLTRVAVCGEGQPGIAKALHELTGMPVAIEDLRRR